MKSRAKIISTVVLLTLLLVGSLWLLRRPPSDDSPTTAPNARSVEPADSLTADSDQVQEEMSAPTTPPPPSDTVAVAPSASPASAPPVQIPDLSTSPITPPADAPQPVASESEQPREELEATAQMYAAHASLRTTEVADPDSTTNRQILGSMIVKMLAQPATTPPSEAAAN